MNFKFKSNESDLKFKIHLNKLEIMNKNILYLTREVDRLVGMVKQMTNDKGLQQQVDKYFEEAPDAEDIEHIPEE